MTERIVRVLVHPFLFLAESWNGIDEHVLLLSKHLDRARFELQVLVQPTDGPQTTLLAQRAGIQAVRTHARGRTLADRLFGLRDLYAGQRIDILHMHSPVAGGQAIPALAARLAGVKSTIATYHQIQPRRQPLRTRSINYAAHATLIDVTLAVSHGVRDTLVSAAGVPSRKILTILNGIDAVEIADGVPRSGLPARAASEVWIGYFGRLSPEKGVAGLIQSLALLAKAAPQARTLIVGDGPSRRELEELVATLGLRERVHFLGFRSDVQSIMRSVDIVAHAPLYEGFGLVILEAMVASRPVVINDAPGGLTEIVAHAETGLIVAGGSPAGLSEALARLVADPVARRRMGANGRARWQRYFSAEEMSRRIGAVYERQLAERARR